MVSASARMWMNQRKEKKQEEGWGGEGRLTSPAERVGVGESFVEIRPWPPEEVVRLQRRSLSGGGGHRVGEYSFRSAVCILVHWVFLFLDESTRFLLFPGDESFVL